MAGSVSTNSRYWSQPLFLLLLVALLATAAGQPVDTIPSAIDAARRRNCVVVSPRGPQDGGDFGPHTPGTKTSGLQEALDHAKRHAQDIYLCGGAYTEGQTPPTVYVLHETLRIPWMQNFRLDGGNCVIHYARPTGNAVEIDSQMSCAYRFGIIVSESDGAVVRIKPASQGPDRFRVVTTTDFYFNALVGGGGAWPGGKPFDSQLDPRHRWIGQGLVLDGKDAPIDSNRFTVVEVVGCDRAVHLAGACTNNRLELGIVHLSNTHLQVGDPGDARTSHNRIAAHLESEGIAGAVGAVIHGHHHQLELSSSRMAAGSDAIFEADAHDNELLSVRLPSGITNRARISTNRLRGAWPGGYRVATPAVPASGAEVVNPELVPVEVRIIDPGRVTRWREIDARGDELLFSSPLTPGQSFTLNPGDRLQLEYDQSPQWRWKGVP